MPFRDRGRRFEEQLDTMYRVWSGQSVDGVGPVGPPPVRAGGPEVLIGGFAEVGVDELVLWPCTPALDRIDRLADLVG